jgi:uncharacterized membrane-anchored protein
VSARGLAAAAWIALQVVFLAAWAFLEESRFTHGVSVLVQPEPVDPRDLLRGQYLELGYDFTRPWTRPDTVLPPDGAPVWVVLVEDDVPEPVTGFHRVTGWHEQPPEMLPPGAVLLRGRVDHGRCLFGVERYFVREGVETPSFEDTIVRLRVDEQGTARIEEVLVNGAPWP